jgi:hypothetical protein
MVPKLNISITRDLISGDEGDTAAQTADSVYCNAAISCARCSYDGQVEATK